MSSSPETAPPAAPVQVLVVDDHPENRTALRAILSSPVYRVVEAGSGAEALLRLLEEDFAVLLIDVVMPDMSGFELAAAIKEREMTAAVPIVFLTAQTTDVDLVFKGYQVGAVDYLTKPLVPEIVRAKVAVFAQLFREKRRNEQQAALLLEAERNENEFRLIALQIASERRYRALAQAVPHIVWTARPDGVVDYFNQRWFEYTGLSVEQAAGSWLGILHSDDSARCRTDWENAMRSGEMFQTECRLRRASDGAFRWHLCRAVPERSTSGQILSWLGTFTDIEDQKRVEAIQAEFKSTLDAEPDAVIIFEPTSWHILYANHGASVLLGYARDELLRMAPSDFMAEHDSVGFRKVLAPLLEGSQPHILIETKFRRRDPPAVLIDVSLQLIRIGANRIVSIARDITERKRTQLERELLYREAVDAIRARDEFLSVASHELRTPLSALQLQIQMLLRPPRRSPQAVLSPEQLKAKLETAYRLIERLTRLIEELMDVSRITAGRLRLELEEIDLSAVVREVVGRFEEEASRTHSDVEVRAVTPVLGMWDRIRVEQVIANLLTNAFKFGGGKPIEIAVEERGPIGRLVVVDHGIGIAREDVERIFQRYEQAISPRAYGGLGLGLYIARQVIEAHGGTIRVQSQPGAGSTFIIDLPKGAITSEEGVARTEGRRPDTSETPQAFPPALGRQ
ncbi:MAG TPA: PAS domain S-box protein [Vicinamibacterales bacterium]|nr:PAS domain S-box protein [Vicinamibacterales bacterium]